MPNHLSHETSPYLLQHANNPVDWYPWSEEAFTLAREQDKPVFLSIGYSTCHWCHVMARESFEDPEIAALLNRHFISVKVDKEERPDIDSVYMRVCLAFTGSGGWPTSIFMTADQKPFFAGTYFPKVSRGGMYGLRELLTVIAEQWKTNRSALLDQAERLLRALQDAGRPENAKADDLPEKAFQAFARDYDSVYGGFGGAPKFPAAHNLLFLLAYGRERRQRYAAEMAEQTLLHMVRGGLFDHVGGGFCRYATDRIFLTPHFEKMLYDNALLIPALCAAGQGTKDEELKRFLLSAARKTGDYVLRELASPEGGFYSAQDADSEGEEGKYYLFTPQELTALLGAEAGQAFCRHYDITPDGNFAGKSIPNEIRSDPYDRSLAPYLPKVLAYRQSRTVLNTDHKILTAWNGLMIAALCVLYRTTREEAYLLAAKKADAFLKRALREGGTVYASFAGGRRGSKGFLDDYAALASAQLELYGATLEESRVTDAEALCHTVLQRFSDAENGGFFLTAADAERLLLRAKELSDGAMPSGNSLMAWNLTRLYQITQKDEWRIAAEQQLSFLASAAAAYPAGFAMTMLAQLVHDSPTTLTVVSPQDPELRSLPFVMPPESVVRVLRQPTAEYPLRNGSTTWYLCSDHRCMPPTNQLAEIVANLNHLNT